jgi:DNA polymerase-3 subunit delta
MITVLAGENSFEIRRALEAIESAFSGTAEHIDGSGLMLSQLPDLFMGATLFGGERLIIIKDLAANSQLWPLLPEWLDRITDTVHIVLVETKLDKRTKTYKDLKQIANMREFAEWTTRDAQAVEQWVKSEAEVRSITMNTASIRELVRRVGYDQWQLHYALEKLAVADAITPEYIQTVIDATPSENVFELFGAALAGNSQKTQTIFRTLALTEDAYKLTGLLSSQAYQLAVLAVADSPSTDVARAIGVHPYALSKLQPLATKHGRSGVRRIVAILTDADHTLKTTGADPWVVLEVALLRIAAL